MTMPSANPVERPQLWVRMAWEITGVGVYSSPSASITSTPLAASTSSLFQIPCHFTSEEPPNDIDHTAALHLYYIAREAVANAAKHSRAAHIHLSLEPARDRYALNIRDDGVGFSAADTRQAGMGLRIMQYRARVIGATLEVTSRPSAGTQVCCLFSPASRPRSVP